ncbi:hypothetical protein [Aquimarina algicola]|uniref:Uncharacterized protein n=1 Tax=Aquimarina algicola TaxID=2589995 RepID=A0A504JHQ6_9FLAO|nr:hypothetical protein [Aquimarina algicola]TPN87945.1 hypothetical protein FHK87_10250 [Aquimarina algicola]
MRKIIFLIACMVTPLLQAQKGKTIDKDVSAAYIAPNYINSSEENEFELSTGAFFFDASKRMGVYNIMKNNSGNFTFKYLGEEQPDAVFETLKDFFTKATADVKGQFTIDGEVKSMVQYMVSQLTNKSDALNFLRTSLYRLNESAFNGDITEEKYNTLFELIITTSAELQKQECSAKKAPIVNNDDNSTVESN